MEFAFSNLHDFLQMGKYGLYVWLCYVLTAFVFIFNVFAYKRKQRKLIKMIQDEQLRKLKQQQNTLS